MNKFEAIAKTTVAALAAVILTTMTVAAAAGPVESVSATRTLAAAAQNPVTANV